VATAQPFSALPCMKLHLTSQYPFLFVRCAIVADAKYELFAAIPSPFESATLFQNHESTTLFQNHESTTLFQSHEVATLFQSHGSAILFQSHEVAILFQSHEVAILFLGRLFSPKRHRTSGSGAVLAPSVLWPAQ